MNTAKAKNIGITVPDILLPSKKIELNKWSVVACDQYTSQRDYWKNAAEVTAGNPTSLEIIFPEVYLEDPDVQVRIDKINRNMKLYLDQGVLENAGPCFVYVERTVSGGKIRKGLVLAVDLDCYNYEKGSCSLTRATEGTVLERIPPRMKIRKDALIESPHIMLLIDDPDKTVIEPLTSRVSPPIYSFDLMLGGGHIKGYKINDDQTIDSIINAFANLADPSNFRAKYNLSSQEPVLLFAAGDGNHSLATAKCHWNELKKNLTEEQQLNHPARYALVEVVNIHDEGLVFEPIHRIIFNIKEDELMAEMRKYFKVRGAVVNINSFNSLSESEKYAASQRISAPRGTQYIVFCSGVKSGVIEIKNSPHPLEVGALQDFLDHSDQSGSMKTDYIHGGDVVADLSSKPGTLGFLLPVMNKGQFFETIIKQGVLPRKTFSMGEAEEKRFYLECRKIK